MALGVLVKTAGLLQGGKTHPSMGRTILQSGIHTVRKQHGGPALVSPSALHWATMSPVPLAPVAGTFLPGWTATWTEPFLLSGARRFITATDHLTRRGLASSPAFLQSTVKVASLGGGMRLAHHRALSPPQAHFVQSLQHWPGLLGGCGVALQEGFKQGLGVGVGAEEGFLQDIEVDSFIFR